MLLFQNFLNVPMSWASLMLGSSNCNSDQTWQGSAALKNGSQREDHMGTRSPVDAPAFNMLELAQELM